jgi:hypothetical protein
LPQTSGLRVWQGKPTFEGPITAKGESSVQAGNFVENIHTGEIRQEGPEYKKEILSEEKAQVQAGNDVDGQKAKTD